MLSYRIVELVHLLYCKLMIFW